jgi:hypothetical protein
LELDLGTANVSRTIEAPHGNRQNALRGSRFTRELGSVHSHHWILVVLLIAGCSSIQPWTPGQKAGFNFVISDNF